MEKQLKTYYKNATVYSVLALVFVTTAFLPIIFGIVPKENVYAHFITWVQLLFVVAGIICYLLSHVNRAKWESIMRKERQRVKEEELNEILEMIQNPKEGINTSDALLNWYNKYLK